MMAARKSNPECAASDKIPKLPVHNPTPIFKPVMTKAAKTEERATDDFSCSCIDEYSMINKIKKAPRHGGTPVHIKIRFIFTCRCALMPKMQGMHRFTRSSPDNFLFMQQSRLSKGTHPGLHSEFGLLRSSAVGTLCARR